MVRTHIREVAASRGITLSEVAQKLGLYLSNLSSMDAGRRSVSLKQLSRIAEFLHCGVGDLLVSSEKNMAPFRDKRLNEQIERLEKANKDGVDKSWVPKVMVSLNAHYARSRRKQ